MSYQVQTRFGLWQVVETFIETKETPAGRVMTTMVRVKDQAGHVVTMPFSQLELLSRNPIGGSGQTGTGPVEWTPAGLTKPGGSDLHLPETVGSLFYKKPKPREGEK